MRIRMMIQTEAPSRSDAPSMQAQFVQLHGVLESLADCLILTNAEGAIRQVNPAMAHFSGYERGELFDRPLECVLRPEEGRLVPPSGDERVMEGVLVARDGSRKVVSVAVSPIQDSDGQVLGYAVSARDMPRTRHLLDELRGAKDGLERAHRTLQESQAQLVQSEKMASIGQMAAGIAHEINNPMAFMTMHLATLAEHLTLFRQLFGEYERLADAVRAGDRAAQEDAMARAGALRRDKNMLYVLSDADHLLARVRAGSNRVKEIVQNLLSFARIDESQRKEASVNDGLRATIGVAWNELKYRCTVHENLNRVPAIWCYPGQLNQVWLNLLMNAVQAIQERGEITVETEATGDHVVVRISDTGAGIAPENLTKLFTPFFTTKPAGKGTGLGLYISYQIVRKHGGTIEVASQVGRGTTFTVCLPIDPRKGAGATTQRRSS